ncbi:MAG: AI-2E family transporter [Chitinophagales bacterium]|nr:AI-2E family transporter [Chitinophagales bacterium]
MNEFPRWLILLLSLLALAVILWVFSTIVGYILLAAALSLVGRPLVSFFTRMRIGRWGIDRSTASVLTIIVMMIIVAGLIAAFAPIISAELRNISAIDINQISEGLVMPLQDTENFFRTYCLKPENDPSIAEHLQRTLQEMVSFSSMSYALDNMMIMASEIFIAVFSVIFILFFFLKDKDMFFNIILTLSPTEYEQKVHHSLDIIKHLLTRYFLGIIIQLTSIFLMVAVGLYIIGIDNFLVIAIVAAVLNIIPYIGPIIGYCFGIVVGITTSVQPGLPFMLVPLLFKITLVFGIIHLIDNFLTQPIVFGNSVKAHPLEIFIVILAAGTLGGIWGMVLAIPIYTVLRVIAKEFFSEAKLVKKLTQRL